MEIVVAGLSFRTAPLAVRERASVPDAEARSVLRYLVGHSGLSAAALLSTCNRTEFYLVSPDRGLSDEVVPRLARYLDPSGTGSVAEHLHALSGRDAVAHMFRVASGLDSMVIGEAQILGQFKTAHRTARDAGTLDARLDFVMRRAVSVAKRVRTQTGIGRRTGSISQTAVDHARAVIGGLDGVGVLLVGAGKMSALAARRLASARARIYVTSRTGESAATLAAELDGTAIGVDNIDSVATEVDVLICSTTSSRPVLDTADVARLQRLRGHRALCILDIAVPRDVDPEAGLVEGVTLVDLDVLGGVIERNLEGRRGEQPAAEAIVERELDPTMTVIDERDAAGPTVAALTRWAEELRRREVERSAGRLADLDAPTRAQLDVLTRSLVRKLLHAPITHLKETAEDPGVALLLREVFDLDETGMNSRSSGRDG
ncbi:MAG TPA: glutamyl-tRNA reductase [Candidatus Dormibacteraeota bacterium]|jgi:glutamyl-tRNA reductase|nr:glutamyl-tRNA reductase [Candidatus Dormibacteraeota bacterium]